MDKRQEKHEGPLDEDLSQALRSALSLLAARDQEQSVAPAPALLRPYFSGDINLDDELTRSFPAMPLMSLIHFRQSAAFHTAALSTQDGAAAMTIAVNPDAHSVQWSFTLASMLSLRFDLTGLSDLDREHWIDKMRLGEGRMAFLWTEARWNQPYLICACHHYVTNVYAFSPHGAEAAVRLTPDVTRRLLTWLQNLWIPGPVTASDSTLKW